MAFLNINIQGRQMGKTTELIRRALTELRSGTDVLFYSNDAKSGDAMYDRMLKALQDDEHLIVDSHEKSYRSIYVRTSLYGLLRFKVMVKSGSKLLGRSRNW